MRPLLLLCLVGCAPASPEELFDFPPGTELRQVDTAPFRERWAAAGMPDPSGCPAITEARVSAEFLQLVCGLPSCYARSYTGGSCCWACARYLTEAPTALFFPPPGEPAPGHSEADELRHETYHAWVACLLDVSGDPAHQLTIWR